MLVVIEVKAKKYCQIRVKLSYKKVSDTMLPYLWTCFVTLRSNYIIIIEVQLNIFCETTLKLIHDFKRQLADRLMDGQRNLINRQGWHILSINEIDVITKRVVTLRFTYDNMIIDNRREIMSCIATSYGKTERGMHI